MCSKEEVRKSCMLVLGPRWSTLFKKEEKRGLLFDPNPGSYALTLLLEASQECLRHRRIVLRFSNLGFDQARFQQQFSPFFYFKAITNPLTLLLILFSLLLRHSSCLPWKLRLRRFSLATGPLLSTHPRLFPSLPPFPTSLLTYLGFISLVEGLVCMWYLPRNSPGL